MMRGKDLSGLGHAVDGGLGEGPVLERLLHLRRRLRHLRLLGDRLLEQEEALLE